MSEEDGKIDEIYKVVRKNNSMVKSMYDAQRRAQIFRLMYWVIIMVVAFVAYLYIEPYVGLFEDIYTNVMESFEKVEGLLEEKESSSE